MIRNPRSMLAGMFALVMVACGGDQGPARDPAQPVLLGLDPVALVEGEETAGQEAFSLVREGHRYIFASAESKAKFEADPAAYEIQGDGSCPVIPQAPANPDIFTVYGKKIYTFASAGCVDSFLADPEAYLP